MEATNPSHAPLWASATLFARLTPEELRELEPLARRTSLDAGETLFRIRDPADTIYVIEAGTVTLTLPVTLRGRETPVSIETQRAGDLVGWSGLVAPYRRTLGARALDPVVLVGFERTDLERVFHAHPGIHLSVTVQLCEVIASRLTLMEAVMLRDLEKWGSHIS